MYLVAFFLYVCQYPVKSQTLYPFISNYAPAYSSKFQLISDVNKTVNKNIYWFSFFYFPFPSPPAPTPSLPTHPLRPVMLTSVPALALSASCLSSVQNNLRFALMGPCHERCYFNLKRQKPQIGIMTEHRNKAVAHAEEMVPSVLHRMECLKTGLTINQPELT